MGHRFRRDSVMLIDYDEQMVRRYIERITVYDSYYEVEFKAGIKVEIEK